MEGLFVLGVLVTTTAVAVVAPYYIFGSSGESVGESWAVGGAAVRFSKVWEDKKNEGKKASSVEFVGDCYVQHSTTKYRCLFSVPVF